MVMLAASLALLACGGETPRPTAPGVTALPPTPIPSNTPAPTPTATPAATATPTPTPPPPTATPTPAPPDTPTPASISEPSVWDELHFSGDPADYSNRHLAEIAQAGVEEFFRIIFDGGPGYALTPGEIARANGFFTPECQAPDEELQAARQYLLAYFGTESSFNEQWQTDAPSIERIADDQAWVWMQAYLAGKPQVTDSTLQVFVDGRWRDADCEPGRAAYAPGPPPLKTATIGQPFQLYDSDGETPYELTLLGPPERAGDMLIIPARIGALLTLFDPYYRSFVGELVMEPMAGGPAQRLFDYPVDTGCPYSIFGQTDVLLAAGGSWVGNICFRPELPEGTTLADWRLVALEYWYGDEPEGRVDFTAANLPPERAIIQPEAFLDALPARLGDAVLLSDCYGREEYELTALQEPEIIAAASGAETARLKVRLTAVADESIELPGYALSLVTAPAEFGQVIEVNPLRMPNSPESPEREVYFQPVNPAEFDGETLPPGQSYEAYIHFGHREGAPLPEAQLAMLAYYHRCEAYFIDLTSGN